MTGDAPQPGETSRSHGNPWTWSDPATGAWWRGDSGPATLTPPKPAEHSGPAGVAHEAGMEDTAAALTGKPAEPKPKRAPRVRRTDGPRDVEHPHDEVGAERFNPGGTATAYQPRSRPEPPVTDQPEPTIVDLLAALPVEDARPAEGARPPRPADVTIDGDAVDVQEVMVLPEPDRNRPTVPLDRGPVPGQAPPSRPRPGRAREDAARADQALQERVRAERTAALLETSPFWLSEEERAKRAATTTPQERAAPRPPRRKIRDPRRPATGLVALLALALVAAFFSWVSAEPFWLAVGHGRTGTATVARCVGEGVSQRCAGTFTPAGSATAVEGVALLGVGSAQRAGGTATPARMVSTSSRQAYVGDTGLLMHLRWTLGFLLVLLCGLGIALLTGTGRLETARARRNALLMSLAGPLLLLGGFLFVTY
ncbi:hypothetical protein [Symbioplanes lichenis]|uniref:hypothetical protein n=1 Tax=Symbioplanes lichenis TaxID=1629072 RepID=UPI0027398CC2|nr:hypothetical protein [Actinoplanes lichenis]